MVILRKDRPVELDEMALLLRGPLAALGAELAVAFGSYARGEADGYSDLDLVVVAPTDLPRLERGSLVADVVDVLPIPADVLVLTPEEFRRGTKRGSGVFEAIAREGVTIYQRSPG